MKRLLWYWKLFWGSRYYIIEEGKEDKEILVYHHKIYVINRRNRDVKEKDG